jgi:hypothetical protein
MIGFLLGMVTGMLLTLLTLFVLTGRSRTEVP